MRVIRTGDFWQTKNRTRGRGAAIAFVWDYRDRHVILRSYGRVTCDRHKPLEFTIPIDVFFDLWGRVSKNTEGRILYSEEEDEAFSHS